MDMTRQSLRKRLGGLIVAVAIGLITGCASSSASRIEEKSAIFQTLTAEEQANIRRGVIEEGYTKDMVYMALGRPTSEEGPEGMGVEKWTYANFYPSKTVAGQNLYQATTPSADDNASVRSKVGNVGAISDNSSTTSVGADVEAAHMEVWFRRGRVMRIQLTP